MKINTALILCAGFGKRLNPLTLKTPKPLLKVKNLTLLEHCINLIKLIGIKKILINSFHLKEQINEFIKNNQFEIDIKVIEDGSNILDTGGGILNLIQKSNEKDFLVFNPDTIWSKNYLPEIMNMIDFHFDKKFKNTLLLVNKSLSFDKNLEGDFDLNNNLISQIQKNYIYTGCQILNRSIFKDKITNNFSITKIWLDLIENNYLGGYQSELEFYHTTNLEIFNKLKDL
jgi:MurNAc alpha-1-phosphate uridylyltransferase